MNMSDQQYSEIQGYLEKITNRLNKVQVMDLVQKDACINDLLQAVKLLLADNIAMQRQLNSNPPNLRNITF